MRIVTISDTHGFHKHLPKPPEGDLFIIAGDISQNGTILELESFNRWLKECGYDKKNILYVPGNHDLLFEKNYSLAKSCLTHCIVLVDACITIEGVKFYGSPITPRYGRWAFMRERGWELDQMWSRVDDDTEVLITHGPPYGTLDLVRNQYQGCESLRNRIKELPNLSLHIFGHIHESRGIHFEKHVSINASSWAHHEHKLYGYTIIERTESGIYNVLAQEGEIHHLNSK